MKIFLALVFSLVSSFADTTLSIVSSNQFKTGTNNIYLNTLTNLATLSNSIVSSIFVSSNTLVTSNWSSLTATNLASNTSLTASNAVITNLLSVSGLSTLTGGAIIGSSGSQILQILKGSGDLDFGSIPTNQIATLTIIVNGAGTNSTVFLNVLSPDTNLTYSAVVNATNTVTVRAANISINAVDPASSGFVTTVLQY